MWQTHFASNRYIQYIWLLLDSYPWPTRFKFHLKSFQLVQSFSIQVEDQLCFLCHPDALQNIRAQVKHHPALCKGEPFFCQFYWMQYWCICYKEKCIQVVSVKILNCTWNWFFMSGIFIHPAGDFNLAVLRMKYDFFRTKKFCNRLQMSKCWTGKRGAFMAIMLRILWTKNLHGSSVYMSFSFNWTDISRNKSQVNWGTSKITAMSVMSSSRCISINALTDLNFFLWSSLKNALFWTIQGP